MSLMLTALIPSQCTVECRDGLQARSVTCRSSDGSIRPNFECDAATRPASVQNCSGSFPNDCLLDPIFIHGDFSPVSTMVINHIHVFD